MARFQGEKLSFEIFGASHAPEIGITVKGLPAGIALDEAALQAFMARRAPGQSDLTTSRKEPDVPVFISGIADGRTSGDPLTAVIRNTNVRSQDYAQLKVIPRPGHADFTAYMKYDGALDMRGGGPFSARMTAPLCILGGICLQALQAQGIRIGAHAAAIAGIEDERFDPVHLDTQTLDRLKGKAFPVLSGAQGAAMQQAIRAAHQAQDSVGGTVECAAIGLPVGLGGALFDGLESRIAALAFGIPAVKGIEFGAGFGVAAMMGSENNDPFAVQDGRVVTTTNHHGGLLGGITSGMPLIFRAALKPTPSIARAQQSVDLATMEATTLEVKGRHDPCVVARAVPVFEAVCAIAIFDAL